MRIQLPKLVESGLMWLYEAGFEGYVVGGCVRDSLLGIQPKDWDITTNATPNEMLKIFDKKVQLFQTNSRFGTLSLVSHGQCCEITTYRTEALYDNHRHPRKIQFVSSLKEDLKRRDFTINAIAYEPFMQKLFDFHKGLEHLSRREIVCIGNPKDRFDEDALRILRAIRFCATKGFYLEKKTKHALLESLPKLEHISSERKREELSAWILGSHAIALLKEFTIVLRYLLGDMWKPPTWNNFEYLPPSLPIRLAAMLLETQSCEKILHNLTYPKIICKTVSIAVAHYPLQPDIVSIKKALFQLGYDAVTIIINLQKTINGDNIDSLFRDAMTQCHNIAMLDIKGTDLLDCVPHNKIRFFLESALFAVIEGKIANQKNDIQDYICQLNATLSH